MKSFICEKFVAGTIHRLVDRLIEKYTWRTITSFTVLCTYIKSYE